MAYGLARGLLSTEDWSKFMKAHTLRVHGADKAVHSATASLVAGVVPSWTSLLKKPSSTKKAKSSSTKVCYALFLGDPPSAQLCTIFQSFGWRGVFAGRG